MANKENILSRIASKIISFLENTFAKFGLVVSTHPFKTIFICIIFSCVCVIGMLRHQEESRREKLWVDQNSLLIHELKWVQEKFPTKSRYIIMIMKRDDILTPEGLTQLLDLHQLVQNIYQNSTNTKLQWKNIRLRSPLSLLELWNFNRTLIMSLTKDDVLTLLNRPNLTSVVTHRSVVISNYLSQISSNSTHKIIKAGVTKMTYFVKRQDVLDTLKGQWVDQTGVDWEIEFARVLKSTSFPESTVYYSTLHSFIQAGFDAIKSDFGLLFSGYALIIFYVVLMLGKFSRIEHKFWLALSGILCVGLSVGVSFGLCAAAGVIYGPVHSILPFLLLGIGVDDIFVIVQTWDNTAGSIKDEESIKQKVSRTMRHAGVAITVTSFTDVCAFLIGATTVLPSLRSFCIYAAVGILMLYIFASSFFVAFLTIDAKRQRANREACCGLKLPADWQPLSCSNNLYLKHFMTVYSKAMLTIPGKILIFVLTAVLLGSGLYGLLNLNQNFDPDWFLPRDSDEILYRQAARQYFPSHGVPTATYIGKINYFKEQQKLHDLYNVIKSESSIIPSSINSWHNHFINWLKSDVNRSAFVVNGIHTDERKFYEDLNVFLQTAGQTYAVDLNYSNTAMLIQASRFRMRHRDINETKDQLNAMYSIRSKTSSIKFASGPSPFTFEAWYYLNWETNKIIGQELLRNLLLASVCVLIVTLFLIANILTSLMVLSCVAFTLVDICGFMYFWDLSIDTIISTILVVALGFTVDYAAHIGHAFMNTRNGNRNERTITAVTDMGPAVFNGGFSTFLAFCLLSLSESYAFQTFFKIFFLVVCLGLFHGLVYLPVLLSLIGPPPYKETKTTSIELAVDVTSGPNHALYTTTDTKVDAEATVGAEFPGTLNKRFEPGEDVVVVPVSDEDKKDNPANGTTHVVYNVIYCNK